MNEISRNIIGKNIKSLRLLLALSQLKFAELTGLSRATVVNIESAKKGYNINLLDNIAQFLDIKLNELSSANFIPSPTIREELIEKYKNVPYFLRTLSETPEIVYAIKYKLLLSSFLDTPKEIHEIKYFFDQLGWNYKGTSISNSLKRMSKSIKIQLHPTKKGTSIYSKIKLDDSVS
jgi:transcriptional regulator with XRE-family HTH domain